MNQQAFSALTAMLNSFPQSAADYRGLLKTYENVLANVADQATVEAAQRFTSGLVDNQNKTFAPSVAEFTTEARRIAELLPYRNRKALEPPKREFFREPPQEDRIRMGFKMDVLSAALGRGCVDAVADANKDGLASMIALGEQLGVAVPPELFKQIKNAA